MGSSSPDLIQDLRSSQIHGNCHQHQHQQPTAITHGYLHGHIHKHRDHTHIHGHIHNHDHISDHNPDHSPDHNPNRNHHRNHHQVLQTHQAGSLSQSHIHGFTPALVNHHQGTGVNDPEVADPIILADSIEACNAFSDYCKDIFCDDLEDCFYGNCPDESTSFATQTLSSHNAPATQTHPSHESHSAIDNIASTPQVFPATLKSDSLDPCRFDHPSTTALHRNSLCNTQLEKRPIFETLIRNLSQIKPNGEIDNSLEENPLEDSVTPETKRQKLEQSDLMIHFPHQCHQLNPLPSVEESHRVAQNQFDDSVETIGSQRHNLHQSCFHTTIPNPDSTYVSTASTNNATRTEPDFDFFIQFNNLSRSLGMRPCCGSTSALNLEARPTTHTQVTQKSELEETLSPPYQYNCQWDHCNHSVDNDTFLKHLMGLHIETQSYQKHSIDNPPSVDPKRMHYQCEWNDCDFFDDDFNSLLNHLQVHKNQSAGISSTAPHLENQNCCPHHHHNQSGAYALTPTSTIKSSALSPISYRSISQQQLPLHNNVNIVSMEIVPKNQSVCNTITDVPPATEFSAATSASALECQWEIGSLPNGEHQVCGMRCNSAEELQQHLIKDHIGSGKSSYTCCWVGCDRHNGKTFAQRQKIYRHIHVHTNYKPCTCSECGAKFAVESTLRQHMRVHLGEKPFVCSICDKTFSTSSSLSIHLRVHTGEKPLECKWPGCKKRFSESSNLTKHMRTHCKLFKCETCGEEFDRKTQYSKHMKDHARNAEESQITQFSLDSKNKLLTAV